MGKPWKVACGIMLRYLAIFLFQCIPEPRLVRPVTNFFVETYLVNKKRGLRDASTAIPVESRQCPHVGIAGVFGV